MQVVGVHKAPLEHDGRGYSWLWPGTGLIPGPTKPITFTSYAFHPPYAALGFRLSGGNLGQILSGSKGFLTVPFNCIIRRAILLANAVGSTVVDIYRVPFSKFPPVSGNNLIQAEEFRPTLNNQQTNQDTALFTWFTTLNQGDVLQFIVVSASGIKALTFMLMVERLGQD